MSFNLKAVLSLDGNKFVSGMDRAEKATKRTQKAMDSMDRTASRSGRTFNSIGGNVGSMTKGLGGLTAGLAGVAAGFAAVEGAKKVFESTVLEAAKFQQSEVMISAMFDSKKLSRQYTDMVDKFAANSPVMNSQDMYGNSKSFIQTSKNIGQLEKMWDLTQRMAAIDPMQGVEGSVFALRELFSGDSQSMVERFEMPRKIMNEIKKLPLEQQLTALDKYFNKIGMTTKLIDDMGGTTLGKFAQVQEKFQLLLRDMGEPALKTVTNFLNKALDRLGGEDIKRFANIGAKWIDKILTGLTNSAIKLFDWFSALTASDEFKSKTSLSAKVSFIIKDVFEAFKDWMDGTGRKQLEKSTKFLMEVAAAGLSNAQGPIVDVATDIGIAIGKALGSAAGKEIKSSVDGWLSNIKIPGMAGVQIGGTIGRKIAGFFEGGNPGTSSSKKKNTYRPIAGQRAHNGGLDYVPYDSYPALLHKGETVLPREEASNRRNGRGGQPINLTVNYSGGGRMDEREMHRFSEFLVRNITIAAESGA
ncbi:hypothetical protein AB9M92_01960 [Peribacillus frigoritolerans]|uniref:hypothetical protein n=1 Tax=Peribacillus frigoritolerans TaxID=450367 RepID=UPI0035197E2D